MSSGYWNHKICLITGASTGLGLAIAQALAERGARVALNARREQPLQEAVELIRRGGGEATAWVGDVTRQEDVDRLAQEIDARLGPLDLLCNCAGRSARSPILETAPDDFQQLLDVNLLAAVRTTRAFAETLIAQRGHLVNIGSLASKVAPRFMGAYPASKFALAAYCQQLRLELGPRGLHVLLACPGPIAREENAPRYTEQTADVPAEARRPGAGAKLRGIEPDWLAKKILTACEQRRSELVVPAKARLLFALAQLSPRWGDWLLGRSTSA